MSDPGSWIASKLTEDNDQVLGAVAVGPGLIKITRRDFPPTHFAYANVPVLDADAVRRIFQAHPTCQFVLNLPAGGRVTLDAAKAAEALGIAVGKFGDATRAVCEPDPTKYVPPETRYVERILRQHSRILSFSRVALLKYQITRRDSPDVTVAVGFDYEVTAEAVRSAIDELGEFHAYVTSNPNAQPISPQAVSAARSSGRHVFLWTEFMSALHRPWS